jgi:hypothetical protein
MRTRALDSARERPNVPAMATQGREPPRTPLLRVGAIEQGRWVVTVDDDPTPISHHSSREEAETGARTHAETFGYPEIIVHELDGDQRTIIIDDPDPRPPYPGRATGESAA